MKLNPNINPPGGFRFIETDGVELKAVSAEKLLEAVWDYRQRRGLPSGKPEQEIADQICARSPESCVQEFDGKALATAVVANLTKLFTTGSVERASSGEAEARAAICAACPFNVDWVTACPPCKKRASEILVHVLRPAKPHAPLKGRACLCAKDDLSVAVKLKQPPEAPGGPERCWRRPQ